MAADRYRREPPADSPPEGYTRRVLDVLTRLTGVVLLGAGLWVALGVIAEAWMLYEDPDRIARLAEAVARGSGVDALLAGPAAEVAGQAATPLRLSYFLAWTIALLLLTLIGRLALAAVKTGGELVLYDLDLRRLARAVMPGAREP